MRSCLDDLTFPSLTWAKFHAPQNKSLVRKGHFDGVLPYYLLEQESTCCDWLTNHLWEFFLLCTHRRVSATANVSRPRDHRDSQPSACWALSAIAAKAHETVPAPVRIVPPGSSSSQEQHKANLLQLDQLAVSNHEPHIPDNKECLTFLSRLLCWDQTSLPITFGTLLWRMVATSWPCGKFNFDIIQPWPMAMQLCLP